MLQGGKYRIVRFISSGGFGCTYEAEHAIFRERVAIKELFVSEICNRDGATGRVSAGTQSNIPLLERIHRKFLDEARAQRQLRHPGIVAVSDVFEENGTAYYVMDYIDGCSLADMLKRRGTLPVAEAIGYIRQVAEALGHVHRNNRLHLDVKPANIMVDARSLRAILIDFGTSKVYSDEHHESTSTLLGHTPGYSSPEQYSADMTIFTPCADIYSLGATLLKLLTGITPPDAGKRFSGGELPALPPDIPAGAAAAIMRSMELRKDKRPQNVEEFLALLDGRDIPTPAAEVKPEPQPQPKLKRKPKRRFGSKKTADDVDETKDMSSSAARQILLVLLLVIGVPLAYYFYTMSKADSVDDLPSEHASATEIPVETAAPEPEQPYITYDEAMARLAKAEDDLANTTELRDAFENQLKFADNAADVAHAKRKLAETEEKINEINTYINELRAAIDDAEQ